MTNHLNPVLPKEAFYRNQTGDEISCDSVRFALGDMETGIRSASWSAMCSNARNSTDMFMVSDGLSDDAKVSFHQRDAIVAYRRERMQSLIERGAIVPDARRQTESVPILDEPFLVASIAFFPAVMKAPDKRRSLSGKAITVIQPPSETEFLRVHVVHSFDEPAELQDHISGLHLRWFARLHSGNRHLTFFHIAYPIDWQAEKNKLEKYVEQIPARDDFIELANKRDVSALFWGVDNTHLNFFEIHGLGIKRQNICPD
jgi:hypothetical protein